MKFKYLSIYTLVLFLLIMPLFGQNPDEEKFRLAESYEKSGDFQNASRLFLELYQSGKMNEKYFEALVRTYKAQNKFTELLPLAEENAQLRRNPQSNSLKAEILWKLGRSDEANTSWADALAVEKNTPATYSTVAASQIACRLFDKAIKTYLKGRQDLGVHNVYADELSQLYIMTSNFIDATKEILMLFETSRNIFIAQGRFSAIINNNPEANEYIYKTLSAKADNNNDTEYKRLLVWFLRATAKFDEAFLITKKLDDMLKSKGFEVLQFANSAFKDEQLEISLKAYEFIIDQGNSTPYLMNGLWGYARTQEAKIQSKAGISPEEVKEIISRYKKIKKDFPKTPTAEDCSIRIATLYNDLVDDKISAIAELKELINLNAKRPVTAIALNMLADINFLLDNIEEYESNLKTIITNFRSISPNDFIMAKYKVAELDYFKSNIDTAQFQLVEMMNIANSDVANDALERIVLIETNKSMTLGLKNFAEAEKLEKQKKFDKALAKFNETIISADFSDLAERSQVKIGKILFNQKKYSESNIAFDTLLSKYPKSIYSDYAFYMTGLCQLESNKTDQALQSLTQFLALYPRSIYIDEVRGKIRKIRKNS